MAFSSCHGMCTKSGIRKHALPSATSASERGCAGSQAISYTRNGCDLAPLLPLHEATDGVPVGD
eukprot:7145360-Pyramimonas_sp.AAC.1